MISKLTRFITLILIIIVLSTINMRLMPRINTLRESSGLTRNLPLENAPPQYVIAVNLLGGLRCILVDLLWLRAMSLQDEGRFFEMAQLLKWICELEPQIEDVWAHNAWNMAYNISYEMPFAEDRWRWIKRALNLLRDDGLYYNARSAKLRREIAWIFSHKIGQSWDDQHWYYKKQLAFEMQTLIKSPDDIRAMARMGDISKTIESSSSLTELWNILKSKQIKTIYQFESALKNQAFVQELSRFNQQDIETLNRILRTKQLKEVYKLDPAVMVDLMDKFGPMDWRLPDPQAIYWAYTGRQYALPEHRIFYDRLIYISLQTLYRRGKLSLIENDNETLYITGPDKEFIKPMNVFYEEILANYKNTSSEKNILASYYYFLSEAVLLLSTYSEPEESKKYFAILEKKFPKKVHGMNYEQFVARQFELTAQTGDYDHVKSLIYTLVRQAYWNLALNNDKQFTGYLRLAQSIYDNYTASTGHQARLELPPIKVFQREVVADALKKDFPEALRTSLKKKLESRTGK